MSSNDVLGRIMNHEMYIVEANHIKNLSKCITTIRKQEIALKANKKSKNKQVAIESSNEEQEEEKEEDSSKCDAEDMALFMKKFKKYIKRSSQKETRSSNPQPREHARIVVTSLLIVHLSIGIMMMTKRTCPTRTRATIEVIRPTRSPMVKLTLGKNESPMMRASTSIVTVWQQWLSREYLLQASLSSQSSIKGNTLALWQRRASVR
jgi:hypothetical protein